MEYDLVSNLQYDITLTTDLLRGDISYVDSHVILNIHTQKNISSQLIPWRAVKQPDVFTWIRFSHMECLFVGPVTLFHTIFSAIP